MAIASPRARHAVVEDVGARFIGQASLDFNISGKSEFLAMVEFLFEVIEPIFLDNLFIEDRI